MWQKGLFSKLPEYVLASSSTEIFVSVRVSVLSALTLFTLAVDLMVQMEFPEVPHPHQ
jgi:hypothetical protein